MSESVAAKAAASLPENNRENRSLFGRERIGAHGQHARISAIHEYARHEHADAVESCN
jgi:hypothetical protein